MPRAAWPGLDEYEVHHDRIEAIGSRASDRTGRGTPRRDHRDAPRGGPLVAREARTADAGRRSGAAPRREARLRPGAPERPAAGGGDPEEGAVRGNLRFAKLVLVLLLTPAFFSIGPLSMSPARLVFLVTMPVMLVQLLRGAYGRILLTDILLLCFIGWMALAVIANHPPRVALEFIGASAVTLLGAYLAGRSGIRCKADFVAMVRFLALIVMVSFPFAIYEVLTSDPILLTLLRQIPGITTNGNINHDPRLGLWRAQFVFPHPIHYGLF